MNQRPSRALCCWPGLAGLWLRGQWSSLVLAVGFSLLLNLALASTFIWPDLLGPWFPQVAWLVVVLTWFLSVLVSRKSLDRLGEPAGYDAVSDDTLFIQAQTEYLKGNWPGGEQLLLRQLNNHPRDLESRLLLASLMRRLGRIQAARQHLETMQKIDGWENWQLEIESEFRLLAEHEARPGKSEDMNDTQTEPNTEEVTAVVKTDIQTENNEPPQLKTGLVRLGEALVRPLEPVTTDQTKHNSHTQKAA